MGLSSPTDSPDPIIEPIDPENVRRLPVLSNGVLSVFVEGYPDTTYTDIAKALVAAKDLSPGNENR